MAKPAATYETTLDVVEAMLELAADLRGQGWTVNVGIETGGPETINFAATRQAAPKSDGEGL